MAGAPRTINPMSEALTIGSVGGGQLIFMEMQAASREKTGDRFIVQEPSDNCPAEQLGAEVIRADYYDRDKTLQLAKSCDVVTYELDHCDGDYLVELSDLGYNILPDPRLLWNLQDKYRQHEFVKKELGFPVPEFRKIETEADLVAFMVDVGDGMVKTLRGGFDGRGCWSTAGMTAEQVFERIRTQNKGIVPEIYVEELVDVGEEFAILASKTANGEMTIYPLLHTEQKDGQCNIATTIDDVDPMVVHDIEDMAATMANTVKGPTFVCMELMMSKSGVLYYLEAAPRVHNSHHLTIERNTTSQFAQHFRMLKGAEPGSVFPLAPAAAMVNILGEDKRPEGSSFSEQDDDDIKMARQAVREAYVHLYGKTARRNRKLGHITTIGLSAESAKKRALEARGLILA